jgi:hypothetical protein
LLSTVHMSSAVHLVAETLVSESGMNVLYINGLRDIENSTLIRRQVNLIDRKEF